MSRTVCRCRARWASFFSTWPGHWPTSISPRSISPPPPSPVSFLLPDDARCSPHHFMDRRDRPVFLGYACLHHNRPPPLRSFLDHHHHHRTIPVRRRRLWLSHAIPAHAAARGATGRQPPSTWLTGWANGARKRSALEIAWKVQSNRFAGRKSLRRSVTDLSSTLSTLDPQLHRLGYNIGCQSDATFRRVAIES